MNKDVRAILDVHRKFRQASYYPKQNIWPNRREVINRVDALWKQIASSVPSQERQAQPVILQGYTLRERHRIGPDGRFYPCLMS